GSWMCGLVVVAEEPDIGSAVYVPVVSVDRLPARLSRKIYKVRHQARHTTVAVHERMDADQGGMGGDTQTSGVDTGPVRPLVVEVVQCVTHFDGDVLGSDANVGFSRALASSPLPDRRIETAVKVAHEVVVEQIPHRYVDVEQVCPPFIGNLNLDALLQVIQVGLADWVTQQLMSFGRERCGFFVVEESLAVVGFEGHQGFE